MKTRHWCECGNEVIHNEDDPFANIERICIKCEKPMKVEYLA